MQGDKFAQAATLQKACENRCGHRPQEYTVLNYNRVTYSQSGFV
jgi:hypothetical protein